jgi:hypothetical protein
MLSSPSEDPMSITLSPSPLLLTDPAATIWVLPWVDERQIPGHDPRSAYVERFWLGIIGPSCAWLLRLIAYGLDSAPEGFSLPTRETARALGMGDRIGRSSPFVRAVDRLCQFDLAVPLPDTSIAVRTSVPWLSRRMISSLPPSLRAEHQRWEVAAGGLPSRPPLVASVAPDGHGHDASIDAYRRRAEDLALAAAQNGASAMEIESLLAQQQFHPSLARHLARWAAGRVGAERAASKPPIATKGSAAPPVTAL